MTIAISGLYVYPIKSCRGIAVQTAQVSVTGLHQDRRWMVVDARGVFITQREQGRLALIAPQLQAVGLSVTAPGMPPLQIEGVTRARPLQVKVWRDQVNAFDEGEVAAQWFSTFMGREARLVRFDETQTRLSAAEWTGAAAGYNQFSDGFPLLAIGTASLDDLNSRLPAPLPMNRFRPNLVLTGLSPYGEDDLYELRAESPIESWCLRVVKPCTRCKITTTDQDTGEAQGTQPLSTLMQYRRNRELKGVTFGQNLIVIAGGALRVGQTLHAVPK